ncbi:MAG TPA: NAD(P)H-dependent glycerol-3-phosphate dehydrogenase [Syntrophothermus lipocalidus]|uniref:Glycerol-3-phosphate dehydrogenase [NAD(P)+] n=1 Tax=Syntrophothermus lipocalidus (strain DSM 12680 / TGB-C1) TaxID=643648 RepID=D7CNE9_SYNLT|nr:MULTISPECIES: NAD(P)H-dependent glycerol-3-phosphate dehydrogenase [Syntrophothermus]ADI02234.1 NAD-dependent glycerol-3-phosphate dehydrogenase domain protein [Syntrophothermus lipocalidus DSM 12680]NSW81962.1 NAD(P)H-dependent glycerol-3-phosphate dehydrogenase [Syntrophothermus sp.]HHV75924.1 NAD(P)H-dependent glycerol-3-phosphate dehydrogenase [Syntrophothermus lipocalidus]
MKKIAVLGAGSWGTALAGLLGNKGYSVCLWGRPEDGVLDIEKTRENRRFLPGVFLPETVSMTTDMKEAISGAWLVVISVPSQAVREVTLKLKPWLGPRTVIVNTAKGLELKTYLRMSQVVAQVLGEEIINRYAVLSGPSHAEEVGQGMPTAVVSASYYKRTAFLVQEVFMTSNFRVYTNPDVAGVELGGALKNIIALGSGITEGLGFGDNPKAALLTRGLSEMARMGVAMGARSQTFAGLSGIGDLVVTCNSLHSRNRRAGMLIGQGKTLKEALDEVGMVVEGVTTARAAYELARRIKVTMPITRATYQVLFRNKDPLEAVSDLMRRKKKHEIEEIVKMTEGW